MGGGEDGSTGEGPLLSGRVAAVASVLAAQLACGGGYVRCGDPECKVDNIFVGHWWPHPDPPGQAFANSAEDSPFVASVVWSPAPSRYEFNTMLADSLFTATPSMSPQRTDAFLATGGWDVKRWTRCGGGTNELLALDEHFPRIQHRAEAVAWSSALFEGAIRDGVTCGSEAYAVPAAIHRVNHTLRARGSSTAMDRVVVNDWSSFEELVQQHPIVVSLDCGSEAFGESLQFLVESLMLVQEQQLGRQAEGEQATQAEPLRCSLWQKPAAQACLKPVLSRLEQLHSEGHLSFFASRSEALEALTQTDTGFMAMPDGYVFDPETHLDWSQRLDSGVFPGTGGTFLFSSEVFAIPRDASGTVHESGVRFLEEVMKPELQAEFAERIGTLPALTPARNPERREELLRSNPEQKAPRMRGNLDHQVDQDPTPIRSLLFDWARQLASMNCAPPAGDPESCTGQTANPPADAGAPEPGGFPTLSDAGSCAPADEFTLLPAASPGCLEEASSVLACRAAEAIEPYLRDPPNPPGCVIDPQSQMLANPAMDGDACNG